MILYNRQKRNAFYAEQHALYGRRLVEAIETEKAGLPLDDDMILVLNRERAKIQAEEARKARSWTKSIKNMLIDGLKQDEEAAGAVETEVPTEGQVLEMMGMNQQRILEAAEEARSEKVEMGEGRRDGNGILQAVEEKRRESEKVMEARGVEGGPLDQMAEGAGEKARR